MQGDEKAYRAMLEMIHTSFRDRFVNPENFITLVDLMIEFADKAALQINTKESRN